MQDKDVQNKLILVALINCLCHACFGFPEVNRKKRDLLDIFGWANRASVQQPITQDLDHDGGYQPCPQKDLSTDFEAHPSCCPYKYLFLGMLLQSLLSDRRGKNEPPRRKLPKKQPSTKIGIISENSTEFVILSDDMSILHEDLQKLMTSTIRLAKEGMVNVASVVPKSLKIIYFGDEGSADHILDEKQSTVSNIDLTESSTASYIINSSSHTERHIKDDSGFRRFFKVGSSNTNKLPSKPTVQETSSKGVYLPEDLPVPDDFYDLGSELTLVVTSAKPINLMKGFFSHWMIFNKQNNDSENEIRYPSNSTVHSTMFPINSLYDTNEIQYSNAPKFFTVSNYINGSVHSITLGSTTLRSFSNVEFDESVSQKSWIYENSTNKLHLKEEFNETGVRGGCNLNMILPINDNRNKALTNYEYESSKSPSLLNSTLNGSLPENFINSTTRIFVVTNNYELFNNSMAYQRDMIQNDWEKEYFSKAYSQSHILSTPVVLNRTLNLKKYTKKIHHQQSSVSPKLNQFFRKQVHETCDLCDMHMQPTVLKPSTPSSLIKSIVELMGFHDKTTASELIHNEMEYAREFGQSQDCLLASTPVIINKYSTTTENVFEANESYNARSNLRITPTLLNDNILWKFKNYGHERSNTYIIKPSKAEFKTQAPFPPIVHDIPERNYTHLAPSKNESKILHLCRG